MRFLQGSAGSWSYGQKIPCLKSETCCISDSKIPKFIATLRDSFQTAAHKHEQMFIYANCLLKFAELV